MQNGYTRSADHEQKVKTNFEENKYLGFNSKTPELKHKQELI